MSTVIAFTFIIELEISNLFPIKSDEKNVTVVLICTTKLDVSIQNVYRNVTLKI